MATTYIWTNNNSDLTGGADWTRALEVGGTAGSATFSIANNSTETSLGFTVADDPSTAGGSGAQNYTVKLNVTSGTTVILCKVSVARVDSSGTVQSTSSETSEQTMSAGSKTFSITSADLGTFATGDRLRVNYIFRSSQTMGGAASITLNGTGNEVDAPWTLAQVFERSASLDATASIATAGQHLFTRSNTAEGGSNGTTVTQGSGGNSGGTSGHYFDVVTIAGSNTLKFSSAQSLKGSLAYELVGASNSEVFLEWGVQSQIPGPQPVTFLRAYVYTPSTPTAARNMFRFRGPLPTLAQQAMLRIDFTGGGANRKFVIRGTDGSTNRWTSSANEPLDSLYRIEMAYSTTLGARVRFFSSPESTSPTEDSDWITTGIGTTDTSYIQCGAGGTQTTYGTTYLDDIGLSNTDWLGPSAAGQTFERAASLDATGSIASSGEFFSIFERSTSVNATGSIAATGQKDLFRAVGLAATADIASSGQVEGQAGQHERSASLDATAGIASTGQIIYQRSASLGATASITASGEIGGIITRSASLDATGTIQATGQRELLRAANLLAQTEIAVSGHVSTILTRSASIDALASIDSSGVFFGPNVGEPVDNARAVLMADEGHAKAQVSEGKAVIVG